MLISIIEKAIREFVVSVELPQISTEYEVQMAIRQVMRDNPDIFLVLASMALCTEYH